MSRPISPCQVPVEQKRVIEEAARWRKPVITATQMLRSISPDGEWIAYESDQVGCLSAPGSVVSLRGVPVPTSAT